MASRFYAAPRTVYGFIFQATPRVSGRLGAEKSSVVVDKVVQTVRIIVFMQIRQKHYGLFSNISYTLVSVDYFLSLFRSTPFCRESRDYRGFLFFSNFFSIACDTSKITSITTRVYEYDESSSFERSRPSGLPLCPVKNLIAGLSRLVFKSSYGAKNIRERRSVWHCHVTAFYGDSKTAAAP